MAFTMQRYLINNLVNADNISASSQGVGTIRQPKKTGTGTASMTPSGSYIGAFNLLFTVQCDTAGSIDGTATFRWKTSATAAGSWEASGIAATSSSTSLSNGVNIQFSSGTLVLNDKWQFPVYAEYGPGKLFLNDRDAFLKSASYTSEIPEFECVTNGDFASDISGWSDNGNGTFAWDTGTLKITASGTNWSHAYQLLSLDEGKRYKISIEITASDTSWGFFAIGSTTPTLQNYDTEADILAQVDCDTITIYTAYFIAGAINYLVISNGDVAGKYINFDNISVKEVNYRLTIDLGSTQSITAVALLDHNAANGNWLSLQGNSSNSWQSPAYELQFNETDDPIIEYISQSYRYWSIEASGLSDFFSLGKLYLGTYSELSGIFKNIPWGSTKADSLQIIENQSESGKANEYVYAQFVEFITQYFPIRTSNDKTVLKAIWAATFDIDTGKRISILVHYFYDEVTTLYLCRCLSKKFDLEYRNYAHYAIALQWKQEIITRII